jgi:hypothetical protein
MATALVHEADGRREDGRKSHGETAPGKPMNAGGKLPQATGRYGAVQAEITEVGKSTWRNPRESMRCSSSTSKPDSVARFSTSVLNKVLADSSIPTLPRFQGVSTFLS